MIFITDGAIVMDFHSFPTWGDIWPYICLLGTLCSALDASLPQPEAGSHWIIPRKIISFLAINVGNAKNEGQPAFTTWAIRMAANALKMDPNQLMVMAQAAEVAIKTTQRQEPTVSATVERGVLTFDTPPPEVKTDPQPEEKKVDSVMASYLKTHPKEVPSKPVPLDGQTSVQGQAHG